MYTHLRVTRMDKPMISTLSTAELHERKTTILASLRRAVVGRARIPGGYRFLVPSSTTIFHEASRMVELESRSCRFLNIRQNKNSVELDVTGSTEALAMIEDLFG